MNSHAETPPGGDPSRDAVQRPAAEADSPAKSDRDKEFGGPKGLEPTRFGDWEKNGRCIDF